MSELITFWIGALYSVESGFINSATAQTVKVDEISKVTAVIQRFKAMPVQYTIQMKDGTEYVSVDRRLERFSK